MSATLHPRPIPASRECCIHEAIHSRKMEGIHTGRITRNAAVRTKPAIVSTPH